MTSTIALPGQQPDQDGDQRGRQRGGVHPDQRAADPVAVQSAQPPGQDPPGDAACRRRSPARTRRRGRPPRRWPEQAQRDQVGHDVHGHRRPGRSGPGSCCRAPRRTPAAGAGRSCTAAGPGRTRRIPRRCSRASRRMQLRRGRGTPRRAWGRARRGPASTAPRWPRRAGRRPRSPAGPAEAGRSAACALMRGSSAVMTEMPTTAYGSWNSSQA